MYLGDYKKDDLYYTNIRYEMLKFVPQNASRILDVGCGAGYFGKEIKAFSTHQNTEVWGVDINENAKSVAEKNIDKLLIGDIETIVDELPENYFDAIFFNDVLEHLVNPDMILDLMKSKLSKNGVIISSIPNIRHHGALKRILVDKDFRYEESGIFDQTHLRFFTEKSIRRLFESQGYEIVSMEGINKTKSLRPWFYIIATFGLIGFDIQFLQFATVAKLKKS